MFTEQIRGLVAGGADVAWIETMSAPEEMRAAARAAIAVGHPVHGHRLVRHRGPHDDGPAPGRASPAVFAGLDPPPLAIGANCGVGASDILVTLLEMDGAARRPPPDLEGQLRRARTSRAPRSSTPATPDLMAEYARLAVDGGAAIVGGCCGTSPDHLRAMRAALDAHDRGAAPTPEQIVERIGPLANSAPETAAASSARGRERRRAPT